MNGYIYVERGNNMIGVAFTGVYPTIKVTKPKTPTPTTPTPTTPTTTTTKKTNKTTTTTKRIM